MAVSMGVALAACSTGSGGGAKSTTTSTPVSAFRTIPSAAATTAPGNATTVITGGGTVTTTAASSSGSGGSSTTAKSSTVATTGKTYVVQAGDFPLGIAKKLGVSLDALLAANGMTTSNFSIHPGQKLNIPAGSTSTTTADHTTTTTKSGATTTVAGASAGIYTVQPNDSWFTIAKRLGVDANAMAALNGMTINTPIHPGEKLKIPANATNATTTTATTAKP